MLLAASLAACGPKETTLTPPIETHRMQTDKKVVYQVFTRLFGNTGTAQKPWGTAEENGVGKFADFTEKALAEIKDLGVTHIWYTGVPHHALIRDYSALGISDDDPDVVKGRAGSPYAVKDYYQVNPDLAVDPERRMEEFEALVQRTHAAGMRVIIDIVPNHVARKYESIGKPEGVRDFGADDDTTVEYARDNDFYYIPGQAFQVPDPLEGYRPLGGEAHPLADGTFEENPAKWTGNGARDAKPHFYDWYETVKVNYGVRPDGTRDFPALPEGYHQADAAAHLAFWETQDVPASWKKWRDIAFFWMDKGVDGFRYDMAEMVPVEFWSYLNSAIKVKNPEAFLLAEIYNPAVYRDYIYSGKMDFLYDKVALYDTLKGIIQGKGSTDAIEKVQQDLTDIHPHMLHFLENHDEQRIASPEFAGNAQAALPAMVLSALLDSGPVMLYFGQEVGEPGAEDAGFGKPSRTSIFDYIGVPHHQRWMNGGAFDGGLLSPEERELRAYYRKLLQLTLSEAAFSGAYASLHGFNRQHTEWYNDRVYSFVRWQGPERILIISNFSAAESYGFDLQLPEELVRAWGWSPGTYAVEELLEGASMQPLQVQERGSIRVDVAPLQSLVIRLPA